MERSSGGLVKQCAVCILLFLHALCGQANDYAIHYEVLYSGDTVRWEIWSKESSLVRAVFTEELSRYSRLLKARNGMDYDYPMPSGSRRSQMVEYHRYVLTAHSIMNNFFMQLLTYEERQAVLKCDRYCLRFTCMVDANGRVSVIPYFDTDKDLYDAGYFRGERLYELARHIKNNVQFPLPSASMVFGGMSMEAGAPLDLSFTGFTGVLNPSIEEYD